MGCLIMMNHLIMFDLDGTLLKVDAEDSLYESAIGEWLSVDSIDKNWASYEHVTDSGIASELYTRIKGHGPSKKGLNNFSEIFFKRWKDRLEVDPTACVPTVGIGMFLSRLQMLDNTFIAIATGGWEKTAKLKLDHCHIQISDSVKATCDDSYSREEIM